MNWLIVAWDKIVRFRLWLAAGVSTALFVIGPILGSPEVLAIIPDHYRSYAVAAAFIIAALMKPRPITRAGDPEAQVVRQMKEIAKAEPVVVTVQGAASGATHVVEKGRK